MRPREQVRKILQFYEATMQRMGVVVVGPSGCGKSTIWRVLQKALRLGCLGVSDVAAFPEGGVQRCAVG